VLLFKGNDLNYGLKNIQIEVEIWKSRKSGANKVEFCYFWNFYKRKQAELQYSLLDHTRTGW